MSMEYIKHTKGTAQRQPIVACANRLELWVEGENSLFCFDEVKTPARRQVG